MTRGQFWALTLKPEQMTPIRQKFHRHKERQLDPMPLT